MLIIQGVLILFPGVISLGIYRKITRDKSSLRTEACRYCCFTLLTFMLANIVLVLTGWPKFTWDYFPAEWIVKYIILAVCLAAVLPCGAAFLKKKFPAWKKLYEKWLERDGGKTPRRTKLNKTDIGMIICTSLAAGFLVAVFTPLEMYFYNQEEFWFDFRLLFPVLLALFGVLLIGNAILLLLFKLWGDRPFRIAIAAEFLVYLCSYIQGNFLVRNLPAMDGRETDWSSYGTDNWITAIVWLVVFILLAAAVIRFGTKKTASLSRWVMAGMTLMLSITLVTECITTDGLKEKIKATISDKELMTMSEDKNFVILLMDAIKSPKFREILEQDEELQKELCDFTFYPDTMGAYPFTSRAIPFVLTGEWFENTEDFKDYQDRVYENNRLWKELREKKYSIGLYTQALPKRKGYIFDFENVIGKSELTSVAGLAMEEAGLSLFKLLPYSLKSSFMPDFERIAALQKDPEEYKKYDNKNSSFFSNLKKKEIEKVGDPVFKFIYLDGAHVPFTYQENMKEVKKSTYEDEIKACGTIMKTYLRKLRESGVYDNSVIVIMSDHGYGGFRQTPVLLVKGAYEKGGERVTISNAPISFDDLQDAYAALLEGKPASGAFAAREGDSRERRFLFFNYTQEFSMMEFFQTGAAWDDGAMRFSGKEYNLHDRTEMSISSLEKNGQDAAYFSNVAIKKLGDDYLVLSGVALDNNQRAPQKFIFEIDGQLYPGVPYEDKKMEKKYPKNGKCGYMITVPKADSVTLHVIAADGTLCNPVVFHLEQP